MLVSESPPSFILRSLVLIQGIMVLVWMMSVWFRRPKVQQPLTIRTARSLLLWSVLNVILHTGHYADNIWSPAKYCEPEWLYRSYILTEMELTFGFFTPLMSTAVGIAILVHSLPDTVHQLTVSKATQLMTNTNRLVWLSMIYLLMSLLSGLHYVVEPPASYAWQANVTISGSCLAAFALLFHAWNAHRQAVRAAAGQTAQTQSRGGAYAPLPLQIQHTQIDA